METPIWGLICVAVITLATTAVDAKRLKDMRKDFLAMRKSKKRTDDLTEIKEKLTAIESLLQRLPEIQAGVFIQMQEEYQDARVQGRRSTDLWTVPPSGKR